MPKYDAIIVGGGHNGLVTAAYLARAGRKVLVLERRELVGGCAVTEEIWPGYRVSTGAYLTSLMQERIVRELELRALRLPGGRARIPPSFPCFPTAATSSCGRTARRRWRRSPSSRSTTPKSIPPTKTNSSASRRWWRTCCSPRRRSFPPRAIGDFDRLPEAGRKDARPQSERHRGAGQDLHAERGGFSRRVVRVRAGEGDARHRRRDRRQWRTALAGHGVHPAAPLHGRGGRTPRAVGLRARRHGRGLGGDRVMRRGPRAPRSGPNAAVSRRCWCAAAARTRVVLENGEEIEGATVASNLDPEGHVPAPGGRARSARGLRGTRSASSASKARVARSISR